LAADAQYQTLETVNHTFASSAVEAEPCDTHQQEQTSEADERGISHADTDKRQHSEELSTGRQHEGSDNFNEGVDTTERRCSNSFDGVVENC
jgi:hypothetical protein